MDAAGGNVSQIASVFSVVAMSNTTHCFFFFQAEDGIRDHCVTGVQTCALPISDLAQDPSIASKLEGITYGSIGVTPGTVNGTFNNMMNFVHTGDVANVLNLPVSGRSGSIVWINTSLATNPASQHFKENYRDDIITLTELAKDAANIGFYNSTLATALRDGVVWKDAALGNSIHVAPGSRFSDVITSQTADNYVLGGAGADEIRFGVGDLTTSHSRVIDGGVGQDRLILPFGKLAFQPPIGDGGDLYYTFGGTTKLVGTLYRIDTIVYYGEPTPKPAAQQVALSSIGARQAAAPAAEGISIDVLDAATGTYKAAFA